MTHDLTAEGPLIPLKDLPKEGCIGPRRNGKRMDIRTGFRWATVGVCGVVLETVVQGGMRYTSRPATLRFFAAVTAAKERKRGGGLAPKKAEDEKNPAEVEGELDRLGL